MIVRAVRLAGDSSQRRETGAHPSVPVLQAALEVSRQDRLWLKQRLTDRKTESDTLRDELTVLARALPDPNRPHELAAEAASPTTPVMTLATQLRHRLKALWDERERLLRVIHEAARERDQMAASLEQATSAADEAARLAEQASQTAEAAAHERNLLAAELEQQHAAPAESRPARRVSRGADVDEIARTLELMATALSDMRERLPPASDEEVPERAVTAVVEGRLEERLQALLSPLAILPALQTQVGTLTARIEHLSACHGGCIADPCTLPRVAPPQSSAASGESSDPIGEHGAPDDAVCRG